MQEIAICKARPLVVSVALVIATVVLGLAIRFAPLGLPWFLRKYGGSALWAAMLYWLVSTLLARVRLPVVALLTAAVAFAVEFFKLVHTPALDRFRGTLAGVLLLGREFSYADLLAYVLAIAAATLLDGAVRRRVGSPMRGPVADR